MTMNILLWLTACIMISAVNSAVSLTYNAALNRPAYLSSVYTNRYGRYAAHLANDGKYETTVTAGGRPRCAISGSETNPWWAVDLGPPTVVYRVDLTSRNDVDARRANKFIVGLTNVHPQESSPTLWNYTLCVQYPGAVPAGATVSVYCPYNLPPFRYVIVQFPITSAVTVCELGVFAIATVSNPAVRNVAFLMQSTQVSTYSDVYGQHPSSLAIDGSRQTNANVTVNGCAVSRRATNPWWAVDLGGPTVVCLVKLTNRGDANGYRSNNFIVGLTNDHPGVNAPVLWNYTVCGQYPGSVPDGATVSLECTNVCERALRFRHVIVQFPLINDQMNVCEIEVYTIDLDLLLNGTTPAVPEQQHTDYTAVASSPTTRSTRETSTTFTTDKRDNVESNPFIAATIAVSVIAAVAIIVAVILLIMLLKRQSDIKQLREQLSKQSAHPAAGQEDYATIEAPNTTPHHYQQMEMTPQS